MLIRGLKTVPALLLCAATPLYVGCACGSSSLGVRTAHAAPKSPCGGKCGTTACAGDCRTSLAFARESTSSDLPPNAVPGECYAKVFIPPQFETVSDRICTRQASERLEIVPAQYEWVEERILVKEAATQLVEVPAQFEWQDQTVQTNGGHTGWIMDKDARCVGANQPARDVFCLVSSPPEYKTVRTQCLVKPAGVQEVVIPAEYNTVRTQRVVHPATTKTISIPAEYQDVEQTVTIATGRMEWQRVNCDANVTTDNTSEAPTPSLVANYSAGPR